MATVEPPPAREIPWIVFLAYQGWAAKGLVARSSCRSRRDSSSNRTLVSRCPSKLVQRRQKCLAGGSGLVLELGGTGVSIGKFLLAYENLSDVLLSRLTTAKTARSARIRLQRGAVRGTSSGLHRAGIYGPRGVRAHFPHCNDQARNAGQCLTPFVRGQLAEG